VLINPAQREPVFAILDALGYTRPPFISGELVMYQAPFERTDHLGVEHALDLHWRIANPQVVSHVLTHDELVAGSVTVNVQGHPMARAFRRRCTAAGLRASRSSPSEL
jgi:hypothetical protein